MKAANNTLNNILTGDFFFQAAYLLGLPEWWIFKQFVCLNSYFQASYIVLMVWT